MHIGSAWLGSAWNRMLSKVFQVHLSRLKLPEEFIVDDQNGCDVTLRSFIRWQRMHALLGLKLPKEFIVEDVRLRLAPVLEDNVGTGPHSTFCLCRMDDVSGQIHSIDACQMTVCAMEFEMVVLKYYQHPSLSGSESQRVLKKLKHGACLKDEVEVDAEFCYYVDCAAPLTATEESTLKWIIGCPFSTSKLNKTSHLFDKDGSFDVIEIGPRLNVSTAFSTNAVSICKSVGLKSIRRIEQSTRYLFKIQKHQIDQGNETGQITADNNPNNLNNDGYANSIRSKFIPLLHDRMTQMYYNAPVESFDLDIHPDPIFEIDLIREGRAALEQASSELGLSFDSWDLDFYTDLFVSKLNRNPTSVECFDLAQSNSEHCRHWFFKGKFFIDGQEMASSLLKIVMDTQMSTNQNNVIKFSDNSSAIKGFELYTLSPEDPYKSSVFVFTYPTYHHVEWHHSQVPQREPEAELEMCKQQVVGQRSLLVLLGTVLAVFTSLAGYDLPWETSQSATYPENLALPLNILIEASNGASDYGNKFGEPIICGFSRSFGLMDVGGERREWVKPIMFTGGVGSILDEHVHKMNPEIGMHVVKIGGPVMRIGVGGGCASSISCQSEERVELDFNAVQRGDAEMGEKMNRVVRGCVELGGRNPICSIHDQGAGGNGNVLKELCHPGGALIKLSAFELADATLSSLEVWTAEYQESNALLVKEEGLGLLKELGNREKCPVSVVGCITGDNKIKFVDDRVATFSTKEPQNKKIKMHIPTNQHPVDLDLDLILGNVPRKKYHVSRLPTNHKPIKLPADVDIFDLLKNVLKLPSVASKRFLTNKVDRSVTGLVAQQQCVGPLHTPLADVAVVALSHFNVKGAATSIGEQPIKMLVDASCGARMTVGEALTNLSFAYVGDIKDVKCSANWMWPAKLPGEDARIYEACVAMAKVMGQLGVAVDGGKDSLSMSAKVDKQVVKSPGSLVVSAYAACPDIYLIVTPDLKVPERKGHLFYVPLTPGKHRLGGSALAQCLGCVGDESPDLEFPELFVNVFAVMQELVKDDRISAGHDVSDGGLLTCVLEMAFAGNCGLDVNFEDLRCQGDCNVSQSMVEFLFAEELGYVIEVSANHVTEVTSKFKDVGASCIPIGCSLPNLDVTIKYNNSAIVSSSTPLLRDIWEETSHQLELLQCEADSAHSQRNWLLEAKPPRYRLTFDMNSILFYDVGHEFKVAVIREEGSNGDREMAAALVLAGFQVYDVNMQDLLNGSVKLTDFRGAVFVGGFSYADVFGSGKGWATSIKFNDDVRRQFEIFAQRPNTFSLGVCNGCQLMTYLGWVGTDVNNKENEIEQSIMLERNASNRYESRFVSVRVGETPSIMMRGLEAAILGVWVAHGEGRFSFRNEKAYQAAYDNRLFSLRYVDETGSPTQTYPLNPNGSRDAIAGICSYDGRHLAMMPHPERSVFTWQWPWKDETFAVGRRWGIDMMENINVSPWLCMFKNAYIWCCHS
ncbi:hypothetical protein HELRODRAFT_190628 [Helobdella robusta]|uniref:Phosphoribosylformylglycinamidine synthase n=1 Tax=Helobdella robusta TaxID=6412 RepID=T1FS56_HELRO|nr:hypothetical protein HELRODRAFT_190628 [Helobdella robusta]ESO08826.1 hypothetical protein HELRODRAFT_190628 [Helobdella robusta]